MAIALLALRPLITTVQAQDFNAVPPNATGQHPAFVEQTRAPVIQDTIRLQATVIADDLENPWGMTQLPDGRWLVTERPGANSLGCREWQ